MNRPYEEVFWEKVLFLCTENHMTYDSFLEEMGEDKPILEFCKALRIMPPDSYVNRIKRYFAMPFDFVLPRERVNRLFFEGARTFVLYKHLWQNRTVFDISRKMVSLTPPQLASMVLSLRAMGISLDEHHLDEPDTTSREFGNLIEPGFPNTHTGWRRRGRALQLQQDFLLAD